MMSTDCPFRYEQFSALVFIRYGLSFLYKPVKGYKTHVDNAFPASVVRKLIVSNADLSVLEAVREKYNYPYYRLRCLTNYYTNC